MLKFHATIKGITPLMMSAPTREPQDGPEFVYFKSCLYQDAKGYYLPGEGFEIAIKEARKLNNDPNPNAGVRVLNERCALDVDAPDTAEGLFADERFVDRRPVRTRDGGSNIIARPIFPTWRTEIDFAINEKRISIDQFVEALNDAGFDVGVGGYRQRFGRFEIADFKEIREADKTI